MYRRLSQLEHEAEELRKRLNGNHDSRPRNRIMSPIGVGLLNGLTDLSHTPQSLGSSSTTGASPAQPIDPLAVNQQSLPINARPAPVVIHATTSPAGSDGPTQARTLKGVVVDAGEIDDIFQMQVFQQRLVRMVMLMVTDSSKIMPRSYRSSTRPPRLTHTTTNQRFYSGQSSSSQVGIIIKIQRCSRHWQSRS